MLKVSVIVCEPVEEKKICIRQSRNRRLIQFLMGLNEVYIVVRGNILMMNPLPSLAQAFALLIQEEKQREFKPNNQMFAEASSVNSSISSSNNVSSSGSSDRRTFRTNYSSNNRSRPFCDYCKKLGHTKDKCFKIHGYPTQNNSQSNGYNGYNNQYKSQNYRSAKGKGIVANAFADLNTGDTDGSSTNPNVSLTKEQYGQLVSLLQHFQLNSINDSNNEEQITSGAANFAGPFTEEASGSW